MADDRGVSFGNSESQTEATEFANNRAYVVGVNDYSNGIPPLRTAVADARRLGELLEELHGYSVRSFPRDSAPSLAALRSLLKETLPQEVGPDDRVLFYFAGHGIALDGEDGPEGYLVPEDAKREDRSSLLAMTELHDALAELPCRHLLLILDCCFAGAFRWSSTRVFSTLPNVIHRERYERYIQDPAWQVITSAAYDQKALDVLSGSTIGERREQSNHSPFADALFRAMEGEADLIPRPRDGQPGGDGVITATELYLYLRECVETATEVRRTRQTPNLWPLNKHRKGEYIFLTPGYSLSLPPAPPLNENNNPYRGLSSYDERHSEFFFGRSELIDELHQVVSKKPLTVVLGASGTGKSSVVKAGLLPRLRNSEENWAILEQIRPDATDEERERVTVIRPGSAPLLSLASIEHPDHTMEHDLTPLAVELRNDPNALAARLQSWSEDNPDAKLLLVVDQLEELVTQCYDSTERECFITQLAHALVELGDRFRLIVTLRSDFEPHFTKTALGSWSASDKFANASSPPSVDDVEVSGDTSHDQDEWSAARFVVPPMSQNELREVIENPASVQVIYFEEGLVDDIINDVVQTPGGLPLLSFTLSELYRKYLERRSGDRCLTTADYQKLGGVGGSLRRCATDIYDTLGGHTHPPDVDGMTVLQRTMQRIMLRMVSVESGELARRRVPQTELNYRDANENQRSRRVLEDLVKARLVVMDKEPDGEPYVEPAHDALVRGWDKLLDWTQSEQEQLTLRRLLTPAAIDWKRGDGGLWSFNSRILLLRHQIRADEDFARNSALYKADGWLNATEAEFVSKSLERRQHTFAAIIGSVAAAFVALSLLTGFAFSEKNRADGEALRATENAKTAKRNESRAVRERDRAESGLFNIQLALVETNWRQDPGFALQLLNNNERCPLQRRDDFTWKHLWDLASPRNRVLFHAADGSARTLDLDDSWKWIAMGRFDGSVAVRDVESGERIVSQDFSEAAVVAVKHAPQGQRLAVVTNDRGVWLWSWRGKHLPIPLAAASDSEEQAYFESPAVTFSPDGNWLSVADDKSVRVWDTNTGQLHQTWEFNGAKCLAFSPDSARLAVGGGGYSPSGNEGLIQLWDIDSGEPLRSISDVGSEVNALAFSPNGDTLASASFNQVTLWDGDSLRFSSSFPHTSFLRGLTFSPNGRLLACCSDRGTIKVWDLQSRATMLTLSDDNPNDVMMFSPDNRSLAVTCARNSQRHEQLGMIRVWEVSTEQATHILAESETIVSGLAFSGDGRSLFSAGYALKSWNLNSSELAFTDQSLGQVRAVATSPDGLWLACGTQDHLVRLLPQPRIIEDVELDELATATVHVDPDGRTMLLATRKQVRVLDLSVSKTLTTRPAPYSFTRTISADGRWVAAIESAEEDRSVQRLMVRDANTGRLKAKLQGPDQDTAAPGADESIAFGPQGNRIAWSKKGVRVWDLTSGQLLETSFDPPWTDGSTIAFSPDGRLLVTADSSNIVNSVPREIIVWDAATGQVRHRFGNHKASIDLLAFSPDSSRLASSDMNGEVAIWDLTTGHLQHRMTFKSPNRLSFAANGSLLVAGMIGGVDSGQPDEMVIGMIWDVASGHERARLYRSEPFTSGGIIGINEGGNLLVEADPLGRIKLWNTAEVVSRPTLSGHTTPVTSLAYSADGQILASSSEDGTVRIWETPSGKLRHALRHADSPVRGLAIASKKGWVASGGDDGEVRLWQLGTGRQLATLDDPTEAVAGLAFSPDEQQLAVAAGNQLFLTSMPEATVVRKLQSAGGGVRSVAYSADGQTVAAAYTDGRVRLWSVADGKLLDALDGHEGPAVCVEFSLDGNRLASAGHDETIIVWDTATRRRISMAAAAARTATDTEWLLELSRDNRLLLTKRGDGTIKLWDTESGTERGTIIGHTHRAGSTVLSDDGELIASVTPRQNIEIWDVESWQRIHSLGAGGQQVMRLRFSPDGSILAAGSDDRSVRLWRTNDGKLLQTLTGHQFPVTALLFSPDGQLLVSVGDQMDLETGFIQVWDVATGERLAKIDDFAGQGGFDASFSSSGATLALRSGSPVSAAFLGELGKLILWDVPERRQRAVLEPISGPLLTYAISPDGSTVATAEGEDRIVFWNALTGDKRFEVRRNKGSVIAMSYSPDGGTLALNGANGAIELWDAVQGQYRASLIGHEAMVARLVFSADSRRLYSIDTDNQVRVWHAHRERAQRTISVPATAIAAAPDGDILALATNNSIQLHKMDSSSQPRLLKHSSELVHSLAFSGDGGLLAAATARAINVWNLTSTGKPRVIEADDTVGSLAFNAGSEFLFAVSRNELKSWEVATGAAGASFPGHEDRRGLRRSSWMLVSNEAAVLSGDGKIIASIGGSSPDIELFDAKGRTNNLLRGHFLPVMCLDMSRDGKILVSGGHDGTAKIWDVSTASPRYTLVGHTRPLTAIALSSDAQLVASSDLGGVIRVWDTQSGEQVEVINDHSDTVRDLLWLLTGKVLVSSSRDGTVKIFDLSQ